MQLFKMENQKLWFTTCGLYVGNFMHRWQWLTFYNNVNFFPVTATSIGCWTGVASILTPADIKELQNASFLHSVVWEVNPWNIW